MALSVCAHLASLIDAEVEVEEAVILILQVEVVKEILHRSVLEASAATTPSKEGLQHHISASEVAAGLVQEVLAETSGLSLLHQVQQLFCIPGMAFSSSLAPSCAPGIR